MLPLKFVYLILIFCSNYCQTPSTLVKAEAKADVQAKRYARHIGAGGIFGGVGVFGLGGGGGGFTAPAYASPPVAVVSSVPVLTTVPVITAVPSYPVYGGYGGYGGALGGFGAGFGVAKFKVKGFDIGGGFFG